MSDMIEKVARAIAAANTTGSGDDVNPSPFAYECARAAIEAMKEATGLSLKPIEEPTEIECLRAVSVVATALVQLQQNKAEPANHPDNQRLYDVGDVILVNESNLCDLETALRALETTYLAKTA